MSLAHLMLKRSPKCQSSTNVSLIYRTIFIALVGLIIVRLCTAHQLAFLWPESHLRLAQNFHTGLTFINKDSRKTHPKHTYAASIAEVMGSSPIAVT